MKSVVLALSSLSILSMGCSHQLMQPKVTSSAADQLHDSAKIDLPLPHLWDDLERTEQALGAHQPGDYVVYRFSGSYRDEPVTLTQRVVERSSERIIVDVTVDEGGEQQRLRLRIKDAGGHLGELISVARLEGNVQQPFGTAAYEKLMNELVLAADENEELLGSTSVTIDVGGGEIACTKTSYRVRVGAHEAVMATLSSDGFPWGHVGGEIVTLDGNVLYKAEIIQLGGTTEAGELAIQEELEGAYEDEYEHLDE